MRHVINYCWFGGNKKSELILKCINSWRVFFPDYEIVEWNETNFDVNCCKYVKEAFESQKWAFVADYCRIWVLYNYGGLYFDTDVEVIKRTDAFENNCVGFENRKTINPGLAISCQEKNWFCKEMLDEYNQDSFCINGKHNYRTICDRATAIFVKHGLRLNNKRQMVDGFTVLPYDYLNPMRSGKLRVTKNTISVHLFAASWVDEEYLKNFKPSFKGKLYVFLSKVFGRRFADAIRGFIIR